jgi:O-antigen/teichoic acid export membrane protein
VGADMANLERCSKILQNFSSLTVGKILGDLVTFVLFVALSRSYGQTGIGQYSLAIGLTGFFMVLADFGLYTFSVKEMSRRLDDLDGFFGRVISTRIILSASVFALLIIVIRVLPFSPETKLIITVVGAYQILTSVMMGFNAVFIAHEVMHLTAIFELSLRAAIAAAGSAIILTGGTLVTVLITFPVLTFVEIIVIYFVIRRRYCRPSLILSWAHTASILRWAMPYGVTSFLRQTCTRSDVVLLGFLLGEAAAGTYNVAYRVVFPLLFLPHFAGISIFPLASKLYTDSQKELKDLYHNSLNLVVLLGIPGSAGIWLIAPELINLIFGEAFAESAIILRYLSWLFLLALLKTFMGIFLISCDRQFQWTKSWWTAAWVNIIGNIVLIQFYGMRGAAVAVLISDVVLVILFAVRLRVLFGWPSVGSRLLISGVATGIFVLAFSLLPYRSLGIVVPASIFVYLATLLVFKQIRKNEVRTLMYILKRKSNRVASLG